MDSGLEDDFEGKLHHDRADGPANHNQSRCGLKDLGDPAAFKYQSEPNSDDRNQYAAKRTFVHSTPHPLR
jgi:hypothetical protein